MKTGMTKYGTFQVGARKTLNIGQEQAWKILCSRAIAKYWTGQQTIIPIIHKELAFENSISGKITTYKADSHLRMQWKKSGWDEASILQIRVIPITKVKTTISFHQEKLTNIEQRDEMKVYWNKVLQIIEKQVL